MSKVLGIAAVLSALTFGYYFDTIAYGITAARAYVLSVGVDYEAKAKECLGQPGQTKECAEAIQKWAARDGNQVVIQYAFSRGVAEAFGGE